MSTCLLIFRSLRHYWRTHLGVVLGAMVSTAVLVGALAVGDSVRHTLHLVAFARLGGVGFAMESGSRLFREELAKLVQGRTLAPAAPALSLRGTAASGDGSARANTVRVLGVDHRFWRLCRRAPRREGLGNGTVVLNERLARQLGARVGDEVVLRIERPSELSRDAPLTPTDDVAIALRRVVGGIAGDQECGRFSLQANLLPPNNAFLHLADLQERFGLGRRANLLLSCGFGGEPFPNSERTALQECWALTDIGVEVRELKWLAEAELRTDRVFLDPPVGAAALKAFPHAIGVLTYFVNELRVGGRATPYSTVTAIGPLAGGKGINGLVPHDIADAEAVVNAWLAEDLGAKPGDELEMSYFVVGPTRKLLEHKSRFRIRAIVPMNGLAADRELMPNFPGVADVDNCRDWKPGIPIDLKKIRPKDEDYWKDHRGTPKAFITLAAGQKMWANRFGNLTAVRIPKPPPGDEIESAILKHLDPADFGLVFRPVREEASRAATQSLDFGELFLGLSFFLIAAAVLLMGLLFVFGIEQRAGQVGLLLALGFTPRRVRRLMLAEGGLLALAGGGAGAFAGTLYTRGVIAALATVWRGAVAGAAVQYHAQASTLLMGGGIGFVVALTAMWLTLRRQAKRPARELLMGGGDLTYRPRPSSSSLALDSPSSLATKKRSRGRGRSAGTIARWRVAPWLGLASIAGAVAIVVAMGARRDQAAALGFFGAGALLLIGGVALCYALLSPVARTRGTDAPPASSTRVVEAPPRIRGLGWRNATRRRGRSLAVVGLLACASFLVFAIGANRKDPLADAAKRSSGTGGFAFYGETALPVFDDLNSREGREAFGLDEAVMKQVSLVALRVRDGDDASCLNLNRAQQPRLLGVNPQAFAARDAFTFVKSAEAADKPWLLLGKSLGEGIVPAVGDEATVTWGLGKSVGDDVEITDGHGRPRTVRIVGVIANSILQGSLLIAEEQFIRLFPSDEGYRAFLIDAPAAILSDIADEVMAELSRTLEQQGWTAGESTRTGDVTLGTKALAEALSHAMQDVGLELTPAARRLAEFGTVENTYLSIFQALGGLAMLLGSVGLGVVVLRNVMERRGELALLRAVGFRRGALVWLVLSEHWGLLGLGLLVGTASAVVAVVPALRSPGADVPYLSLSVTLVTVAASGLLWTWLATLAALRGPLLDALRNE